MAKASCAGFPRIKSTTCLALRGEIRKYFAVAFTSRPHPPHLRAVERPVGLPCPLKVRVRANSPSLCPTICSVM